MRGLLTDEIKSPSDRQLRDYFQVNRAAYAYPENRSLQHVFFSDPSQVPSNLRDKLNAGLDPGDLGELRPGMGRNLPRRSKTEIASMLGPEAAHTLLGIQDDQWHGPIESPRGIHFLRIIEREPQRDADFEHIKAYLQRDWLMAQSQVVVQQEIERLLDAYEVDIEEGARQ